MDHAYRRSGTFIAMYLSAGLAASQDIQSDPPVDNAGAASRPAEPAVNEVATPPAAVTQATASPSTPVDSIPVEIAPVATDEDLSRESSGPRNRTIEEVVVTAQKREERLQDVPISIAAFSSEALDARGVFDTKALATITPALSITEFGGYSFVYIRGVGTDVFVPSADPSVTTYIDGIYVPSSQGLVTDFGGIERVEVLKGPQGTLFGRNSTGGAISVVTKKPGETFEGSVQGQLGNFNERRIKGFVTTPITDTIGASLDLIYKHIDSPYSHPDRELAADRSLAGRARVNWHPTDNFDIDLSYFRSDQKSTGSLISKNIKTSIIGGLLLIPEQPDDYQLSSDYPSYVKGYYEVASFGLRWSLPWFDAKIFGSDQSNVTDYTAYDFDGSALPLVGFYAKDQFTDAQTAEVQLVSRTDGWGGHDFDWVAGSYYVHSLGGYNNITLQLGKGVLNYAVTNALPLDLPDNVVDLFTRLDQFDGPGLTLQGIMGTKSISGYGQGTWHATDWFALTVGGRYQSEERYLTASNTSLFDSVTGNTIELLPYDLKSDKRTNLSTKFNVSVTPRDGVLIYASRSEGFKSATYNIAAIYTPPDFVKPELVTSYELGFKADFFARLLRLNAAIFDNSIKNKQTSNVALISGGAVRLDNAQKASIRGAEFDLTLTPLPDLDPGLAVTANGAYLHTVYDKFTSADDFNPTTGIYSSNLDNTGHEIERTPKFSGGVGVTQTMEAGRTGELELGADVYYNSGFFYTATNDDNDKEDAYKLVNARVSYLYTPWDLRITAFGKNLFDERYHTGLFQTDFGILSNLAYPVTYGLRVDWIF
ncbi:MAG: TonB-dependent receptor [Hydrocarboniphaga sp.]|uniref:TonB-dependent receptor n=1 Tax=Hydrocarboniphaga sp. TaxID=2033016 RepID=UPI00260EAAF7|nr:TonB-dependent receptor [Hydrocarboniphaga sp.]MDB5969679.1 TonB-dependent receptor [Hydrocarboniphaga sp.]